MSIDQFDRPDYGQQFSATREERIDSTGHFQFDLIGTDEDVNFLVGDLARQISPDTKLRLLIMESVDLEGNPVPLLVGAKPGETRPTSLHRIMVCEDGESDQIASIVLESHDPDLHPHVEICDPVDIQTFGRLYTAFVKEQRRSQAPNN